MENIFRGVFDLVFPRRPNDAAIAGETPDSFFQKTAKWDAEAYPGIRAAFHYKDPTVKALVLELKSARSRHAADIAAHALSACFEEGAHSVIVPMPISRKRRRERGYNQCELMAEAMRRRSVGLEVRTDILERPAHTAKFALSDRKHRLEAAHGIFRARFDASLAARSIVVIDDVVTTGATMRAALESLREAGFHDITGLALAH